MPPWLPALALFIDTTPHSAALNMAIDEALLATIPGPVLRVYQWARPSVSFGYFDDWPAVRAAWPGRDPVRRWTGGGIVPHGRDLTYSLLIPRVENLPLPGPAQSYHLIHGALCPALRATGIDAAASAGSRCNGTRACFDNPVTDDIILAGQKIAGAAQRRTKIGLLHQGSIQAPGLTLPENFPSQFAKHLAIEVTETHFDVMAHANNLAAKKYATPEWLEHQPRAAPRQ